MTASEKVNDCGSQSFDLLCYFGNAEIWGRCDMAGPLCRRKRDNEFPCITFAETVEKIVGLLQRSHQLQSGLVKPRADDGRMTLAGAMALKFKVLQYGASPTFNSNTKWHPEADEYTCYGNYSDQRWKDAAEAGAAFSQNYRNGTNTN